MNEAAGIVLPPGSKPAPSPACHPVTGHRIVGAAGRRIDPNQSFYPVTSILLSGYLYPDPKFLSGPGGVQSAPPVGGT